MARTTNSVIYDTAYAKGLVKNYKNNQWQIINANFAQYNIKDSRCVWLSIDDIQNFLTQIQQPNPAGTVATGVRIYFGAYSGEYPNPDNANYNHLHTLLMLPTHHNATDGKDYDFDAFTGTSDFANLSTVSALNRGHLIPPPFNVAGTDNMYQQGNLFMDYADNY